MVGAGQGLLPGLDRGPLLAVAAQDLGKHAERAPVAAGAAAWAGACAWVVRWS